MKRIATAVGLSILLAACGGGGDDSAPAGGGSAPAAAPPVAAGTAEGFWQGKSSTGSSVALAVLENGETWGLYSQGGYIVGALYGNTTSTGGTKLSGSGLDFNIPSRSVTQGSYSGTFEAKGSVDVTMSTGATFKGTYDATYDQAPAPLTALAGTFTGTGVSGTSPVQTASVTIRDDGYFSTSLAPQCFVSGSIAPRSSGKNVYDVVAGFTGADCALGNGASTTGTAYYDAASKHIEVLAVNAAKSDGFIYIGSK